MLKYYSFSDVNDGSFRQNLKMTEPSEKTLREKITKIWPDVYRDKLSRDQMTEVDLEWKMTFPMWKKLKWVKWQE